jgi:acyl-coenzyme A thioesterase PaaI-like protein
VTGERGNKERGATPLQDDGLCFGCGPHNDIGLKLTFVWDGDTYRTCWTPSRQHQGWSDRVHGGLLALVLDETLSRAALERYGLHWVTAELTTRLLRPAALGEALTAEARIVVAKPRLIICEGEIRTEIDNAVVATGQAKLMRVPSDSPIVGGGGAIFSSEA